MLYEKIEISNPYFVILAFSFQVVYKCFNQSQYQTCSAHVKKFGQNIGIQEGHQMNPYKQRKLIPFSSNFEFLSLYS